MSVGHRIADDAETACALEVATVAVQFCRRFGPSAAVNALVIAAAGLAFVNGASAADFARLAAHQFDQVTREGQAGAKS